MERTSSFKNIIMTIALAICIAMTPFNAYASSDGDDSNGNGGILFLLAAGPAFYIITKARYKGTNLRHEYENDTESKIQNVKGNHILLYKEKGSSYSTIGKIEYSEDPNKKLKKAVGINAKSCPIKENYITDRLSDIENLELLDIEVGDPHKKPKLADNNSLEKEMLEYANAFKANNT